jgi:uncharacterized surface protein with fasciclin (FAS1) repeats
MFDPFDNRQWGGLQLGVLENKYLIMEKLPHEKYRDTLAEHLMDQDKDERKEILDGAQETDKYKDAELKKALTPVSFAFVEKYIELKNQIKILSEKRRILEGGINKSEVDKYRAEESLLEDEADFIKERISVEYFDFDRRQSYSNWVYDDKDKRINNVQGCINRQVDSLKSVFGEVDMSILKKIEERLAEDEKRFKNEIEELENASPVDGENPEILKSKLKNKRTDLKTTQYYLKYHIVPGEYRLENLFKDELALGAQNTIAQESGE